MLVMVNVWAQRVPCGTSPKLWTIIGGGTCSRLVAMSGRKNLLAHGATGPGGAGCWARPTAARHTPIATDNDRLICRPPAASRDAQRVVPRQSAGTHTSFGKPGNPGSHHMIPGPAGQAAAHRAESVVPVSRRPG